MTKRHVSLPEETRATAEGFVEYVDERLSGDEDVYDVVTEVLVDLFGEREAYERMRDGEDLSPAERARLASYDPRNATLESEYYAEVALGEEEFRRSKALQWLWRQFDASPMADNVDFGHRFRGVLADHLFSEAGENLRLFKGITMTYGHNVTVGDNVVIHDDVHLDDRGELVIGDRVSLADGTHVYTHDHDVVDQTEVRNYRTVIGDDARLTYDTMVRAGCEVGENALVGARGVVQNDVPDHHIAVGMPAKSISIKPGFEDETIPIEEANDRHQDDREIPYDLPEGLDTFDEFERPPRLSEPVQPHRRS